MPIDWSRPFRTTDDKVARLIASDLGGSAPFAIAVRFPQAERVFRVDADGICPESANINLHNLFLDDTVWVNVYSTRSGGLSCSKSFSTEPAAAAGVRNERTLVGRNSVILRAVFD